MVAIEHRQKSAIIATDTTATNLTATASSPRRSSDIANSNDITVLSPSNTATSSLTTTTITTPTETAPSNIAVIIPRQDSKGPEYDAELNVSPNRNKNPSTDMSQSSSEASTVTAETAANAANQQQCEADLSTPAAETASVSSKSAVSQRNVDIKIANKSNKDNATQELTKKVLKLDLTGKEVLNEYSIKSPKSPIATRLPHQTSLTTVDVEDRKTLREALYHGIFHRHRRTIFAVGSFLRMLRSRNSSYNTIRSSSEGEDTDEVR